MQPDISDQKESTDTLPSSLDTLIGIIHDDYTDDYVEYVSEKYA